MGTSASLCDCEGPSLSVGTRCGSDAQPSRWMRLQQSFSSSACIADTHRSSTVASNSGALVSVVEAASTSKEQPILEPRRSLRSSFSFSQSAHNSSVSGCDECFAVLTPTVDSEELIDLHWTVARSGAQTEQLCQQQTPLFGPTGERFLKFCHPAVALVESSDDLDDDEYSAVFDDVTDTFQLRDHRTGRALHFDNTTNAASSSTFFCVTDNTVR